MCRLLGWVSRPGLTVRDVLGAKSHDRDLRPILGQGRPATVDGGIEAVEAEALCFGLRYRRTDDSVVMASSGFAQPEGGGWRAIENNSIFVVDRAALAVESFALTSDLRPGSRAGCLDSQTIVRLGTTSERLLPAAGRCMWSDCQVHAHRV
jgi:hypothetical protein